MIRDERAATSPISYSLTIAMATILITGLVVAGSGHVSDQRSTTARAQMDVVAQQVAGNLEAADRLVRSTDSPPSTLELERQLPEQVLGSGYTVEIDDSSDRVVVSSPISDRTVTATFDVETDVVGSTVRDGRITISYDTGDDELEVTDG